MTLGESALACRPQGGQAYSGVDAALPEAVTRVSGFKNASSSSLAGTLKATPPTSSEGRKAATPGSAKKPAKRKGGLSMFLAGGVSSITQCHNEWR